MPQAIPAKQIDSTGVLNTKKVIMGVRAEDFTTTAASSDSSDTLNKLIFDSSLSKKLSGSTSVEAIIDSGSPLNVCQLRDNATGDPIENGSNEQVFGELTSAETSLSAATYTWNGTTTVSPSSDPSGELAAGEWIALDSDGQYFEVDSIGAGPGFDITILNPGSLTIPSGATGSSKADFTLSYYTITGGSKTAHSFASPTDVDIKFPESTALFNTRFSDMRLDRFGGFNETLPRDTYTDIGSGNPNTTSGAAAIGTDASAIGANAGSTDTVQGVLEAFDSAITAAAAASGTPQQERVTTEAISTDSPITDTLSATPSSAANLVLFLNGIQQIQGAGEDYTVSGDTITWLAGTGTAVDLEATDDLVAYYTS